MKKGIQMVAFGGMDIKEAFKMAAKYGFDGVEINFNSETKDVGLTTTKADADKIVSYAKEAGIKIPSICAAWPPLTSNSADERKKAIEYVNKAIEVASWVGADTVLVVPGTVTEEVPYDVACERSKAAMLEIAPVAEKFKVYVGIENVWNKMLLSPLEAKAFIESINKPYIKFYFDVGNVLISGYPEQWIRILGKHIKKIHLKDFNTSTGNITGFVDLLEGDVNWKAVQEALKEIGYDDFVTAEYWPHKFFRETMVEKLSISIDRIIGR